MQLFLDFEGYRSRYYFIEFAKEVFKALLILSMAMGVIVLACACV